MYSNCQSSSNASPLPWSFPGSIYVLLPILYIRLVIFISESFFSFHILLLEVLSILWRWEKWEMIIFSCIIQFAKCSESDSIVKFFFLFSFPWCFTHTVIENLDSFQCHSQDSLSLKISQPLADSPHVGWSSSCISHYLATSICSSAPLFQCILWAGQVAGFVAGLMSKSHNWYLTWVTEDGSGSISSETRIPC